MFKDFRNKIDQWKMLGLIERAVMIFHFPNGSLYVCLDIPTVKDSNNLNLTAEVLKQIPEPIIKSINEISEKNAVKLTITNYSVEIENAKIQHKKNGTPYYDNASTNEILRFA